MSDFKMEFKGFEEYSKVLKSFSRARIANIHKKALNRAIQPFESALKGTSAWADRTGELRSSIRVESSSKPSQGYVSIGVKANYRGRFLEFGWVPGRRPTTRVERARRIAAAGGRKVGQTHWVTSVYDALRDGAMNQILNDLSTEVIKSFKRAKLK